jgi:hypothetical protein
MAVLLDTNILLRLSQPHHPHNSIAKQALIILRRQDEVLHIASQNVVEFWGCRYAAIHLNGLAYNIEQAAAEIAHCGGYLNCFQRSPSKSNGNGLSEPSVSGERTPTMRGW